MKDKLLALLAFLGAIFGALFYREKAKGAEAKLKGEKEARDTEKKATTAMTEGLDNEAKNLNNDIKSDHFE